MTKKGIYISCSKNVVENNHIKNPPENGIILRKNYTCNIYANTIRSDNQ